MDNDNLVELDHYLNGQCHTLAVALHRHLGWELVAVLNDDAFFWEDPEDPDNGIPEVIHVYAVDPNHQAWDIRGSRPAAQVVADAAEWFALSEQSLSTDWMKSEIELATYVGEGIDDEGNEFDRPLFAYTDTDVAQAWADAVKHLPLPPQHRRQRPSALPAPNGRFGSVGFGSCRAVMLCYSEGVHLSYGKLMNLKSIALGAVLGVLSAAVLLPAAPVDAQGVYMPVGRSNDPFVFCSEGMPLHGWIAVDPTSGTWTPISQYVNYQWIPTYVAICPRAMKRGMWKGPGTGSTHPFVH